MTEPNGEAHARLTAMHKDWRLAEERRMQASRNREMAQQTEIGASADALAKEARFKGAFELLYGADAAWKYDESSGTLSMIPPALAKKQAALRVAAHVPGKRRR